MGFPFDAVRVGTTREVAVAPQTMLFEQIL